MYGKFRGGGFPPAKGATEFQSAPLAPEPPAAFTTATATGGRDAGMLASGEKSHFSRPFVIPPAFRRPPAKASNARGLNIETIELIVPANQRLH